MVSFYASYPLNGGGGGVPTYPTFTDLPAVASNGSLAVTLDTDTLYVYSSGMAAWLPIATPGDALAIGTYDSGTASVNGLHIDTNAIIAQSASATRPGMVNTGTQTFAGAKTFTGAISASNLSGTNTGDVTLGSANGLSIVGQALSLALSSTSTTGALSSTDWNTFNNKQATLTIGNLTDVGTDGITVTGGTGSVIGSGTSLSQHVADSTHNGYLSQTDWSTFNSKQASGNYITALTGDVAATGPGSVAATIQAGAVDNGKVAAGAAIAFSKLATLSSANILVGSAGNVATATAVTGDISLTNGGVTAYSGTVPLNKGGTGQTTKAPAFDALSPMSTVGALILGGTSGTGTSLPIGSNTFVLTSNGTTASWAANAAAATATPTATGLTSSYFPIIQSSVTTVTNADATINTTDGFALVLMSTSNTNRLVNLPAAASNTGRVLELVKIDSGTGRATYDPNGSETVAGQATLSLFKQYESAKIISDGANWQLIGANWAAGSYTPTASAGTNCAAATTPAVSLYQRLGPVYVAVWPRFSADPTAATNTLTSLTLTLPLTISNFTGDTQATGTTNGSAPAGSAYQPGIVLSTNAAQTVDIFYNATDVANRGHQGSFMYAIVL